MILFELNNQELKSEDIQICRQFVDMNDMEVIPAGRYELEAGIYAIMVKCNVEKGKSTQIKRIVFKIPVK